MNPIRFRTLSLRYGRHDRSVEFGVSAQPFVILGDNGAGKSTLLEALVRTLYGFQRRRADERALHQHRRPWTGGQFAAVVTLDGPERSIRIARDFETDEVRVHDEGGDVLFEGEANPGSATGDTIRRYRELLRQNMGLAELDLYRRTGWVSQGDLMGTELGDDLLRIAAGGHTAVESAIQQLRSEYRELTVEPMGPDDARRRKAGRLERLRERAAELGAALEEARAVERRRAPRLKRLAELREALEVATREIEELEEAFEQVVRAEKLEAERASLRERIGRIEATGRQLESALSELAMWSREPNPPQPYPEDFLERVAGLEEGVWSRAARLDQRRRQLRQREERERAEAERYARTATVLAILGLTIGVSLIGLGMLAPSLPLVLGGVVSTALGAWTAWSGRRTRDRRPVDDERLELDREAAEVERLRDRLLAGVPEPDSLTPETLPVRRREFDRQAARNANRARIETGLRGAMDRARQEVEGARPEAALDLGGGTLELRARVLQRELDDVASELRNDRLAPLTFGLQETARQAMRLPEGVPPRSHDISRARSERRRLVARLASEQDEIRRSLAADAEGESPHGLSRDLAETEAEAERVATRAATYRVAYDLLRRGYDAFRQSDQARLVRAISSRLESLSGGDVGPLVVGAGADLETAMLELEGRTVPLQAPPLSYGQYHLALFAVRLGTTEFLSDLGVGVPVVIDEPFAHLDPGRAAELWQVLSAVARSRQVIVATQDALLLEHLGVQPDVALKLESRRDRPASGPSRPTNGKPRPPTTPRDGLELDLWSGPGGPEPGG